MRKTLVASAVIAALLGTTAAAADTATPIKHLIVVIGENHSFDNLFATYQPRDGESIRNLLSQGIVDADGLPGANYGLAVQRRARNDDHRYDIAPERLAPYAVLPQPTLTGVYKPDFTLYPNIPDPRFASLDVNGPFQISRWVPYASPTSATGDPVHRFFQMWQQTGGDNARHDLFTWVATTVGVGGATSPEITAENTGNGGELMGFFNMARGDAPYFKSLADAFAISDNYHQAIMGGTGANFFAIATGDLAVYNEAGEPAIPPLNQIEDPDPARRTGNFYLNDGYAGGSYVNCSDARQPGVAAILEFIGEHDGRSGCEHGAYYLVNNYDPPYDIAGHAKPLGADKFVYPPQDRPTIGQSLSAKGVSWAWYTGGRDATDVTGDPLYPFVYNLVYPQVLAAVKAQLPAGTPDAVAAAIAAQATPQQAIPIAQSYIYNAIGDPHNATRAVATGPLRANLKGQASFFAAVADGSLPAVSFVVPKNLDSGHPGYSVTAAYEAYVANLIAQVQAQPALWRDTAIVVTTDEGGGYFDSGAIQNLDFFGDGPRIPLFVVSPYAKKGHVDHVYLDHASILKFIERNWKLPPLSGRSRDRLPNPVQRDGAYLPANAPAIGDLSTLFDFPRRGE